MNGSDGRDESHQGASERTSIGGLCVRLECLVERRPVTLLVLLTAGMAMALFREFLFLQKLYLFKDIGRDTVNVFFPRYVHIADMLRGGVVLQWSFQRGMGQNLFPAGLGDPFNRILPVAGPDPGRGHL